MREYSNEYLKSELRVRFSGRSNHLRMSCTTVLLRKELFAPQNNREEFGRVRMEFASRLSIEINPQLACVWALLP